MRQFKCLMNVKKTILTDVEDYRSIASTADFFAKRDREAALNIIREAAAEYISEWFKNPQILYFSDPDEEYEKTVIGAEDPDMIIRIASIWNDNISNSLKNTLDEISKRSDQENIPFANFIMLNSIAGGDAGNLIDDLRKRLDAASNTPRMYGTEEIVISAPLCIGTRITDEDFAYINKHPDDWVIVHLNYI